MKSNVLKQIIVWAVIVGVLLLLYFTDAKGLFEVALLVPFSYAISLLYNRKSKK